MKIQVIYLSVLFKIKYYKILICWDNGRKRKKKQVTSVPVVAAYEMLAYSLHSILAPRSHFTSIYFFIFRPSCKQISSY